MSRTATSVVLLIILCGSACGARKNLFPVKEQVGVAAPVPSPTDGICKTLVEKSGYACEEHTVTTKDGFVLSLQRIPEGRFGKTSGTKPPVLLQHGILLDGASWVVLSPEESLGFILADNGFDVWIGNSRGTKFSSRHASFNRSDPAFWDWTWDELAAYDLPAMVQYVHNQTRQNLHCVACSLGTLIALAALSKDQQLKSMRSAALLAPIAYIGHTTSQLVRIGADIVTANASYWLNLAELDPMGAPIIALVTDICSRPGVDCNDLLTSFSGPNCCLGSNLLAVFLGNVAQSTSTKNMIHLAQMVKEGTLTMYNYGDERENRKHYGQPMPPAYNVTEIPNDFPLFLGHGGADAISDVKDVQLLLESLEYHVKDNLTVKYVENYAHLDIVFGINAKEVVFDPLVDFLKLH